METIEYQTKDKSNWGDGPWQNEPDKKQWQDEATGLPCLIVRNQMGALCGYVGVPPSHPMYGKQYDDVDVDVHGGLTFAKRCAKKGSEAESICHRVTEGESDDIWWLGFDCAHAYDLMPSDKISDMLREESEYRDLAYVTEECRSLAEQLAKMK